MTAITQTGLERAFKALELAAAAGERCPCSVGPNAERAVGPGYVGALARAGPHAGKSTAPNPNPKARPYQIIDTGGQRRIGNGAA